MSSICNDVLLNEIIPFIGDGLSLRDFVNTCKAIQLLCFSGGINVDATIPPLPKKGHALDRAILKSKTATGALSILRKHPKALMKHPDIKMRILSSVMSDLTGYCLKRLTEPPFSFTRNDIINQYGCAMGYAAHYGNSSAFEQFAQEPFNITGEDVKKVPSIMIMACEGYKPALLDILADVYGMDASDINLEITKVWSPEIAWRLSLPPYSLMWDPEDETLSINMQ